ncbi:MAG: hypothetical protein QCI82_07815 [Candidatus Thermoplasmatota archaeon]|nr:hypothetical protein [Candidatus Thermoplasmatota archaeon]
MSPISTERKGRIVVAAFIVVAMLFMIGLIVWGPRGEPKEKERIESGPWSDLKGFKRTVNDFSTIKYYEVSSPMTLSTTDDPSKTLYMLIGIEKPLNSSEFFTIRDFIHSGGKVLVADDGTLANDLGLIPKSTGNGEVEFLGHPYIVQAMQGESDTGFQGNRSFVKTQANINGRILNVITHDPMGLNHTGSGNVVLKTTKQLTVVDLNRNYVQELSDLYKPFGPIAVEYQLGDNGGGIVFFSTTGLFTDNVFKLEDNEAFTRSYIVTLLPEGGSILFDPSKQASSRSPHRTVL